MIARLQSLIESRIFELVIMTVIIGNAITLGLETSPAVMAEYGGLLTAIDRAVLGVFVVELAARAIVYRTRFFNDPWRVFDFVIVAVALMPATGNLSVLRALRILRVLRLVSIVPSLRRVVGGLISALPGMGSIVLLLVLVFYIFAVMATNLFGASFPDMFGSIGASLLTLFQIMTLDSFTTAVLYPVMEVYPYSWIFFIPFVIATSFAVLNLFIGIIVSAMQEQHESETIDDRLSMKSDQDAILDEMRALREELRELRRDTNMRD